MGHFYPTQDIIIRLSYKQEGDWHVWWSGGRDINHWCSRWLLDVWWTGIVYCDGMPLSNWPSIVL